MYKNKFEYMELVTKSLNNRDKYEQSSFVINYAFKNRFCETWRSMFLYKTNKPTEKDAQLGNFYFECDEKDFNLNKNIILTAVEYINEEYNIPYEFFDLFITNKSIWVSIPFKVFNCKGSINLHKIYKEMAIEINEQLKKNLPVKGNCLDLSIYRWNGLIHSLGSYLPKVKRWVNKCTISDLENAYTLEDLLSSKWDMYSNFNDIKEIPNAIKWFNKSKDKVLYGKVINQSKKDYDYLKEVIKRIESSIIEEGYRNNGVCTYALALKGIEKSKEEIKRIIQDWLINNNQQVFAFSKEFNKTIDSIYREKYNFSFKRAKELLPIVDFSNITKKNKKDSFIVPRSFITDLHDNKCNYNCYKILLEIIYSQQVEDKIYVKSLEKEKYKNNIISYFEKLKEIGFICFEIKEDKIYAQLIIKENKIYKNHIVIKNSLIKDGILKKMKNEIKVYIELLRSSYISKNNNYYFNIKKETIINNLKCTSRYLNKSLTKLYKSKLVINKYVCFGDKKDYNNLIRIMVKKINKKGIKTTDSISSKTNHKVIYSKKHISDTTLLYQYIQDLFEKYFWKVKDIEQLSIVKDK